MNLKLSENLPIIALSTIIITIAIAAAWNTTYHVVDGIQFKLNILLPILAMVSLLFLAKEFKKHSNNFSLSLSQLSILSLFLFGSLSFFWVEDKVIFFEKWLLWFSGVFLFYLVARINFKNHLNTIALVISLSGLLLSVIGISQYLFSFPDFQLLQYNNIPASTFGNKNAANQYLVLVFPLTLFLLVNGKNDLIKFFSGFTIVSIAFYMFYSVTKGAWIAVSVEILIFFLYALFNKKIAKSLFSYKSLGFLFFSAFFFLFLQSFTPKDISLETSISKAVSSVQERYKDSQSPRWVIWKNSLEFMWESPIIGHGLGNYTHLTINQGIHQKLQRVHNDYFELIIELGLLGFISFLAASFFIVKDIFLINKNHLKDVVFLNSIFLSLVGVSIHMLVSWPAQTIYGILLISLFYALIASSAKIYSKKVINFDTKRLLYRPYLFISFLVFLYGAYYMKLQSDALSFFYYNSGTQGFKYNKSNLTKFAPNLARRDLHLNSIASKFHLAGYEKRALDIYTLASDNNSLALYRLAVDATNKGEIDKALTYAEKLKKNSPNNPLTYLARLQLAKKKGDLSAAKIIYSEFKKSVVDKAIYDYRGYLYLHQWSIIIQEYQDTPIFYKKLLEREGKQDHIENKMINFYVYTSQYEKALPHLKFVLEAKPEIVDPLILRALIDKGFVKLKENDSKTSK